MNHNARSELMMSSTYSVKEGEHRERCLLCSSQSTACHREAMLSQKNSVSS